MRHHEMNDPDNGFIAGFYIEDDALIHRIIDHHSNGNQIKGQVGTKDGHCVDPTLKDSVDVELDGAVFEEYMNALANCFHEYNLLYPESNKTAPYGVLEVVNIQRYDPPAGGYHSWHTERASGHFPSVMRHLVFMTYLNDVEEGGETEWKYQKLRVKPEKGLTVIWPSDWTHTHRGLVAPTETKYIVTGWVDFAPPQPTHEF
jgi:hypothetical protein